jgi:uncharacterized integral membrane protein
LLRKAIAALILVPLAIVIIALAMANRQIVTVSLDPFNSSPPAATVSVPLFVLIIVLLIIGVVLGGAASWLGQGRWRRTARRHEREAAKLRGDLAVLKPHAAPTDAASTTEPPPRLKLRLPAR